MILTQTNLVTPENGPRPAGKPDRCFYCQEPIGAEHKPDCVCRRKVVIVEVTVTFPRVMPQDWDAEINEFHMNESSSCQNNLIDFDLDRYREACGDGFCLCGLIQGRHLRDATPQDLEDVDLNVLAGLTPHSNNPTDSASDRA